MMRPDEVRKTKGYSTTAVSDRIRAQVVELEKQMPKGTKLEIVQDAGQRVANRTRHVLFYHRSQDARSRKARSPRSDGESVRVCK